MKCMHKIVVFSFFTFCTFPDLLFVYIQSVTNLFKQNKCLLKIMPLRYKTLQQTEAFKQYLDQPTKHWQQHNFSANISSPYHQQNLLITQNTLEHLDGNFHSNCATTPETIDQEEQLPTTKKMLYETSKELTQDIPSVMPDKFLKKNIVTEIRSVKGKIMVY